MFTRFTERLRQKVDSLWEAWDRPVRDVQHLANFRRTGAACKCLLERYATATITQDQCMLVFATPHSDRAMVLLNASSSAA